MTLIAAAGAAIVGTEAWSDADVVLAVQAPTVQQASLLKSGAVVIGMLSPLKNAR